MDSDFKKKIGTCIEILDKLAGSLADSNNFDSCRVKKQHDSMSAIYNDLTNILKMLNGIYKVYEIEEKNIREKFDEIIR